MQTCLGEDSRALQAASWAVPIPTQHRHPPTAAPCAAPAGAAHLPTQPSAAMAPACIPAALQQAAAQRWRQRQQPLQAAAAARGSALVCRGVDPKYERSLVGENFGARDATAGELASNFSEKVLGNFDTEHMIKLVGSPMVGHAFSPACTWLLASTGDASTADALLRCVCFHCRCLPTATPPAACRAHLCSPSLSPCHLCAALQASREAGRVGWSEEQEVSSL